MQVLLARPLTSVLEEGKALNKIIEKSKIWFSISLIIIITGLVFMGINGLNTGIDFKGGTLITLEMNQDFVKSDVDSIIDTYAENKFLTKVVNNGEQLEIRLQEGILSEEEISKLIEEISEKYSLESDALIGNITVGATVGKELKRNAAIAILIATIAMLIYITVRFEISFAVAAIIALVHDVLITISFYAILGIQINLPFIAAILTIVGYSINDTIVVFDRIRENSKKSRGKSYVEIADVSIRETLARSINTTLTTLITIVAVYVFVPSIREFSLPLIIGITSGAYSSIFIASPLWVIFKSSKQKKKKNAAA